MNVKIRARIAIFVTLSITAFVYGEWLEGQQNDLAEGWSQLGNQRPAAYEQKFTLTDLLKYSPFYLGSIGLFLRNKKIWNKVFSVVVFLGGVCGVLGILGFVLFFSHGIRLGIFPFFVVCALLWNYREVFADEERQL